MREDLIRYKKMILTWKSIKGEARKETQELIEHLEQGLDILEFPNLKCVGETLISYDKLRRRTKESNRRVMPNFDIWGGGV